MEDVVDGCEVIQTGKTGQILRRVDQFGQRIQLLRRLERMLPPKEMKPKVTVVYRRVWAILSPQSKQRLYSPLQVTGQNNLLALA